jgi:hypothetical protein
MLEKSILATLDDLPTKLISTHTDRANPILKDAP